MATMTWVQYVSDDGTTYQRRTRTELVTPLGLTATTRGAEQRLPANIKARYVDFASSTGRRFKARGVGAASGIFTGATTSLAWPDPDDIASTITVGREGAVGEKRYVR